MDELSPEPIFSQTAARDLYEMAKTFPQRGLNEAKKWIADGSEHHVVAGRWARGTALFELGDNEAALAELERAIDEGPPLLNDWVAITLAAAESAAGRSDEAISRLKRLDRSDDQQVRAYALSQLGLILLHDGDLAASKQASESAKQLYMEWPDEEAALYKVLNNIAYCCLMTGQVREALDNLVPSLQLAKGCGHPLQEASIQQNLAYAEMCLGNLPTAFKRYRQSLDLYLEFGEASRNLATIYDDMAEAYRLAGLNRDSLEYAQRSVWVARQGTNVEKQADAEFRRARCLVDLAEFDAAVKAASAAAEAYRAAGRDIWVGRSELLVLEAAARQDQTLTTTDDGLADDLNKLLARAPTIADELDKSGWSSEALAARSLAAEVHLHRGDLNTSAAILKEQKSGSAAEPLGERLERLYGQALAALVAGGSVEPALIQARELLITHTAQMADPELRAGSARLAGRFRAMALDAALADSPLNPLALLQAEERWRSLARQSPASLPRSDEEVDLLARLRILTQQRLESDERDSGLEQQISELEYEVRARALAMGVTTGDAGTPSDSGADLGPLERWLGQTDGLFVELIEHRDELHVLVADGLTADRVTHRVVTDADQLAALARRLETTLAKLLRTATAGQADVLWRATVDDARRLAHLLFGDDGFDPTATERPVVLSPPPGLATLPWSLILGGQRSVSLVPNGSTWCDPGDHLDPARAGVIVGPGLSAGHNDITAFTQAMSAPTVAFGQAATADEMLDQLTSRSILHLATHCSFRSDNVMFSSIDTANGPVSVYDLSRLDRTPDLVVLAACEAGKASGEAGQWLGIVPELLRSGTRCLVAPFHPVADDDAATVAAHFYHHLSSHPVADAVARTQADVADAAPRLQAAAYTFTTFGHGASRLGDIPG